MARVRLIFKSVSEIVGSKELGLLVLTDSAEQRQVAVPCDKRILEEFGMRLGHRGNTDKMLPEVLQNLIKWQTDLSLEIHIDSLHDGRYQAVLSNTDTLEELPLYATDAVLLLYLSRGDYPCSWTRDCLPVRARSTTVSQREFPCLSTRSTMKCCSVHSKKP